MRIKSLAKLSTCVAVIPFLVACNNDDEAVVSSVTSKTISFASVAYPATEEQKMAPQFISKAMINGKETALPYQTLLRAGDSLGGQAFGVVMGENGLPVAGIDDNAEMSQPFRAVSQSNSLDFTSLLPVGDKLYSVAHFETTPGALYLTELHQDKQTGKLTAVQTRSLDLSGVYGGVNFCAGSVSPWGTHLASEEKDPDAKAIEKTGKSGDDAFDDFMKYYFGGDSAKLNPYAYGFIPEVTVKSFNDARVVKHYAMGRVAHELAYVLPDKKTALIADDIGEDGVLLLFIADKAEDLSAGTLYAAKWTQTKSDGAGEATLSWVNLGHATDAEIKAAIDRQVKFSELFNDIALNSDKTCPAGYTLINAGEKGELECLQVKNDKLASRLETRRYAAVKGATTELNKVEGLTFDAATKTAYLAISRIENGMMDNDKTFDAPGINHVKLAKNSCGAVYALPTVAGQKDTTSGTIASDYVPNAMKPEVVGILNSDGKTCSNDGIAGPDNVSFMTGYNMLLISEDTSKRQEDIDMLWAYNLATKKLERLGTTPYGSEFTGGYWYPDLNGWSYLVANIQAPFADAEDKIVGTENYAKTKAYNGYFTFPVVK